MTTSNSNQPKGEQLQLTTLLTAVPANLPANSTVTVGGVVYTQAQLIAYITSLLAPILASIAAKQAFTAAAQARAKNNPTVHTFLAEFRAVIVGLFGRSSPILVQFGYTPYKAKTTTAGQKVVTAAKTMASKKKLGTKTPKQKAALLATEPPAFSVGADGTVALASGTGSGTPGSNGTAS